MDFQTMISNIYGQLRDLGLHANYMGFFHASYAVLLTATGPDLPPAAKWLYAAVAEQYQTTPENVERSIRSVVNAVWLQDPESLERLAHQRLTRKPSVLQFITILARNITYRRAA